MIGTAKNLNSLLWDIMPISPLRVHRRFRGTCYLYLHCLRISQARKQPEAVIKQALLASSFARLWIWWWKAISSSETSADFQRIAPRYIPQNGNIHNYRWENLKSYNTLTCLRILIILPSTKFNENHLELKNSWNWDAYIVYFCCERPRN
jgi:hypothetical protein